MGTMFLMVYSENIAFSFIEKWYESSFQKLECWLDMIKHKIGK